MTDDYNIKHIIINIFIMAITARRYVTTTRLLLQARNDYCVSN